MNALQRQPNLPILRAADGGAVIRSDRMNTHEAAAFLMVNEPAITNSDILPTNGEVMWKLDRAVVEGSSAIASAEPWPC
jgi:hypothetical protein